MKYDQKLINVLETYKSNWINCIDKSGKKHGGLLAYWSETGVLLTNGTKMHDPIIELQGTGATVSEIIAINEIESIYIKKLGTDNQTIDVLVAGKTTCRDS